MEKLAKKVGDKLSKLEGSLHKSSQEQPAPPPGAPPPSAPSGYPSVPSSESPDTASAQGVSSGGSSSGPQPSDEPGVVADGSQPSGSAAPADSAEKKKGWKDKVAGKIQEKVSTALQDPKVQKNVQKFLKEEALKHLSGKKKEHH